VGRFQIWRAGGDDALLHFVAAGAGAEYRFEERGLGAGVDGGLGAGDCVCGLISVLDFTTRSCCLQDMVGRALSLMLKLKNKNSGASHIHRMKNVAMSVKPGTLSSCTGRPYILWDLWRASCVIFAKWKNHRKWSAMTRMQDAMKEGEVSEMTGQVSEKFWR
jgi:hypothetical protein